jgi:SAM-dependent methyltransferase
MSVKYDAAQAREFFDGYGAVDNDWDNDPLNKVSFHIHCRYLRRYLKPGDKVFDAGAGAGRYTIEMARIGAKVTVGDISPRQLELNRVQVEQAGCESNIEARVVADIVDLSQFATASFDAVVCYGGALSYTNDRAPDALEELLRVAKPGRYVLLGVGSALGTMRSSLREVLRLADRHGAEALLPVFDIGRAHAGASDGGDCRLYRWVELEALLKKHSCTIVTASADYFLSSQGVIDDLVARPELWNTLLGWEVFLCREAGVLDAGRSIIAVVRREAAGPGNRL